MARESVIRMPSDLAVRGEASAAHTRRVWSAPALEELAPLRELTLQSPIGGDQGGFSWLDLADPARRLG